MWGKQRGALIFSLICARINGWVNNGEAGGLRRHRAHYDVIVMIYVTRVVNGLSIWQAVDQPSTDAIPGVPYCKNKYIFSTINFGFGFQPATEYWVYECVPRWIEFDFSHCLTFPEIPEGFIWRENVRTSTILISTSGHLTHRKRVNCGVGKYISLHSNSNNNLSQLMSYLLVSQSLCHNAPATQYKTNNSFLFRH